MDNIINYMVYTVYIILSDTLQCRSCPVLRVRPQAGPRRAAAMSSNLCWVSWDVLSRCVNGTRSSRWARKFAETGVIFLHLPRCSGSSIEDSLFGLQGESQHNCASYWRDLLGPDAYDAAFKFTFVREPLDRYLSAFDYLLQRVDRADGVRLSRHDTLSAEILRDVFGSDPVRHLKHLATLGNDNWQCVELHFRPLMDVIGGGALSSLNFVGRFENLQQDYAALVACQFPRAGPLSHHRASAADYVANPHSVDGCQLPPCGLGLGAAKKTALHHLPTVAVLCEHVYAADYEAFGYKCPRGGPLTCTPIPY